MRFSVFFIFFFPTLICSGKYLEINAEGAFEEMQKRHTSQAWNCEIKPDKHAAQYETAIEAEGNLAAENYQEAFKLGLLVAKSGNQYWQFRVARFYLDGIEGCLQPDQETGIKWYLTALENTETLPDWGHAHQNAQLKSVIEDLLEQKGVTEAEITQIKLAHMQL
jgi:hypothetical protein